MQIHSGGWLQATPHAVRGCKGGNVSRETFAVFMEPEYHSSMKLPEGRTLEHTQCIKAERWLPRNVRTLRSRWKLGMNVSTGIYAIALFQTFVIVSLSKYLSLCPAVYFTEEATCYGNMVHPLAREIQLDVAWNTIRGRYSL